jgi:hypothetical protein
MIPVETIPEMGGGEVKENEWRWWRGLIEV